MATRRQKAAARKNIKKALAARKHKAKRLENPAKKTRKKSSKRATSTTTKKRRKSAAKSTSTPKKRRKSAAKRTMATKKTSRKRRYSRRRSVGVMLPKPRSRKKQRVVTVYVKSPARKRRKKAAAAPKKRRASTKRRSAAKRRRRVTSGATLMLKANPVKRRRKKSSKRRSARRAGTQRVTVRRSTRKIVIQRNPLMGMGYEQNPYGYGALLDNPLEGGMALYDNPVDGMGGAFATSNLKRFGVAASGVALGLVIADFADRFVATRKPRDAKDGTKATLAWYGRDAAAIQRSRPDAYRLGAQVVGAAGSVYISYAYRTKNFVPWAFGGLALGFGANLIKMLADFYVMPAIFKVKEGEEGKASFANRMYPLEQKLVQDKVGELFSNWSETPDLKAAQPDSGKPEDAQILSPLSSGEKESGIYTLGEAQNAFVGAPRVVGQEIAANFLGCPGDCPQGVTLGQADRPLAEYRVQPGDDIARMAASVGVNAAEIARLNPGRSMQEISSPGSAVVIPYELASAIEMGALNGTPSMVGAASDAGVEISTILDRVVMGNSVLSPIGQNEMSPPGSLRPVPYTDEPGGPGQVVRSADCGGSCGQDNCDTCKERDILLAPPTMSQGFYPPAFSPTAITEITEQPAAPAPEAAAPPVFIPRPDLTVKPETTRPELTPRVPPTMFVPRPDLTVKPGTVRPVLTPRVPPMPFKPAVNLQPQTPVARPKLTLQTPQPATGIRRPDIAIISTVRGNPTAEEPKQFLFREEMTDKI